MASTSRYSRQNEDDEERPRRRPVKKSGPPIGPIVALLFIIGGAIVVARFAAGNKEEVVEKPPVDSSVVFGDLPKEEPPVPGSGGPGRKRSTNKAPTGLANNATWIAALHTADEAAVVFAKAKAAKAAQNHGEWNKLGTEAKELYDKAFIDTALWEEELMEKYGDADKQVRDIVRTRNKWIDVVRTLHKTTGRS